MNNHENNQNAGAIGLFDSGLGGLTVLREMQRLLPHERFVYLGDTARTPYGPKSPETIVRYSEECGDFLISQKLKMLVIACNTSSCYALTRLQTRFDVPVLGTIEPAVSAALRATKTKSVLLLGTKATVASGVYQRRLQELSPELKISAKACPLFVPLVEEGLTSGPIVADTIAHYLKEFKNSDIDTVILGCTHYPLLRETLSQFFGPKVTLVECSTVLAEEAHEVLKTKSQLAVSSAVKLADQFFVTDDPSQFNQQARFFLQSNGVTAERVMSLFSPF